MSNYDRIYEELLEQENTLQFSKFDSKEALKLGMLLVEKAKSEGKNVAIDITLNGHQLFYYAFDGTSPDNSEWIKRKNKVVNRFFMSSYRMGIKLKKENLSLEEKYFISTREYSPHGGSFPIIIRNVGVVGTITVSGLAQEEDHRLVVEGIKEYLKIQR